jgi:Sulphur oxidation protein SoxZ
MADSVKIRAKQQGGLVEIKVLIAHEMETGLRKTPEGALIPAWFIKEITVRCNGLVARRCLRILSCLSPFLVERRGTALRCNGSTIKAYKARERPGCPDFWLQNPFLFKALSNFFSSRLPLVLS